MLKYIKPSPPPRGLFFAWMMAKGRDGRMADLSQGGEIMLHHAKKFFLALTAAILVGCAAGPTPQQIASADYGSPIGQEQAEERIKQYFNGTLKDPYSAQYQFSKVEKGYIIGSAVQGKPLYAGYLITANVNAKNSYGGYTGNQAYQFLFQNGLLVQGLKLSPTGVHMPLF